MIAALRRIRLLCGLIAVGGFAIIGVSHLVALLTHAPGNGFLGAAEPAVFIVACTLVVAAVISIPYLRETTHPGGSRGSAATKSPVTRLSEDSLR
ncbi:hypothetical protein [Microbacterium sp. MYb64]|uniref:hypothetical protein n=1 Tax=Microbacterium sp. MYb64 TaxID=1848691 RepID=UPI0011B07F0C|nr:hypothetical protein [Microbacterium sp. MYb64]